MRSGRKKRKMRGLLIVNDPTQETYENFLLNLERLQRPEHVHSMRVAAEGMGIEIAEAEEIIRETESEWEEVIQDESAAEGEVD